jgi:hypothetical protein
MVVLPKALLERYSSALGADGGKPRMVWNSMDGSALGSLGGLALHETISKAKGNRYTAKLSRRPSFDLHTDPVYVSKHVRTTSAAVCVSCWFCGFFCDGIYCTAGPWDTSGSIKPPERVYKSGIDLGESWDAKKRKARLDESKRRNPKNTVILNRIPAAKPQPSRRTRGKSSSLGQLPNTGVSRDSSEGGSGHDDDDNTSGIESGPHSEYLREVARELSAQVYCAHGFAENCWLHVMCWMYVCLLEQEPLVGAVEAATDQVIPDN